MSRRVWLTLVVTVAVVAGGIAWVGWGGQDVYRHALVRYDDHHGEPNRYYNLEDGRAQLAIGSPDRHRIVVQWRDPDGHGWTGPETVWKDEKNVAIDNAIRYGAGTVAIRQVYTTDVHSDSDIDSFTIGIVCHELTCVAQKTSGYGGEPQVTPDGRTVYLGQDRRGAYLWTSESGIHRSPWSGHPGFEYGVVSPSEPVLAPDGSLRVVTSRPSRGSCTFELLAGAPRTAELTSVGRTTERVRGRSVSDCASYLMTYSADWVTVYPSDHRAPDFWFVRGGDRWTGTKDDPSGLRLVDVDRGCCDTSVIGFVHWNDVAFGSPDGHRLLVQHHFLGEESWSDPELLDGAPADYRCSSFLDGREVGETGFAVLMACHSGRSSPTAYAVALSPDLRQWESAFITGVREDPGVDGDQLRVGDTTWTVGTSTLSRQDGQE